MRSGKWLNFLAGLVVAVSFSGSGAPFSEVREDRSPTPFVDEPDSNTEFIVNFWRSGDGLPVNEIQDLKETPDGFLWLGTHRGLIRFDGVKFQSFLTTPTGAQFGTRMGPLEVDHGGRLWIAPDAVGLLRLDPHGFSEVLTNGSNLKARVTSLCANGTNGLYWVDASGGLGRVMPESPDADEQVKGGNAVSASRWLAGANGELWLENPRGLQIYEKGSWRAVEVPGTATLTATPRHAGGVWIAREGKLRFVTPDGTNNEIGIFPWKGQTRVNCLLEDRVGRLWIGTVGQGLFCFARGEFQQVARTASSILCLMEDSQNNLWAGTRGAGLLRVRSRQFFMHDRKTGLANEFVRSLAQDKLGRMWIITAEGGLGWWENKKWHPLSAADGWPGIDALCVLPAVDGSVWVSTARRGLWLWTDEKFKRAGPEAGLMREPAVDLLEDRQRRLWMVTDNSGLYCWAAGKLKAYGQAQGLPSGLIRRLIEDDSGRLWAGDWEGGIAVLQNDKHWQIVRKPSGHGDAVRCMAVQNGVLWIGTSAGGLLRLKEGKTTRISDTQGMPDVCIQQLLLDERGSLWGGTPHTLFRLALEQLEEVAEGRRQKIDAVSYGRSDGLPDISFASWCDPRCGRAGSGELWFATANGAVHFDPASPQEGKPPQVFLEQTLLDGKLMNESELKALRPGPGRLEFKFTAPCLTAPDRVRFRYQLSGVDSDWVDAGAERSAAYPNIPAGQHTFKVLASNPEGMWGASPATIALAFYPYFWQTSWFLIVVAAVVAGGVVWLIRRATVRRLNLRLERLRHQHAVDQERARIAQDIHDELGANLTSIGLLADMGIRHKSDPAALTRELGQISHTARASVAAMDAIVWALNPRNDSLDHFANYIAQFTRDFFAPTALRTRLEVPADLPALPLSTEARHELFLLVKESFNNVVRHSQASEVRLELACDHDQLRLTIADNGRGLPVKPGPQSRNGLGNLRERIEKLGGTLHIESKANEGTKLDFVVGLGNFRTN